MIPVPEITCIVCPMGCRIGVESKNGELELNGEGCRRGEQYVRDEVTCPKRVLTSVVTVEGSRQLLPVKTAAPIPKELIFAAMTEIKKIQAPGEIKIGEVIKENLAGTGVPLVAAKNIEL
jgi:CxxC motif-containing protein